MKKFQHFLMLMLFALPIGIFAQPTFTITSATVGCDDPDFTINLDVADFSNVLSWQFAVEWDSELYKLVNVNDPGTLGGIQVGQGRVDDVGLDTITFVWFSLMSGGTTIPDNSILNFTFQPTGQATNTSSFSYIPIPPSFPIEVVYFNGGVPTTSGHTLNTGTVQVTDNQNPTITCPGDITMDTNGTSSTQITGAGFTANDNCNIDFVSYNMTGATTGTGIGDVSNNINFNVGTTTVEYTVNDTGGNTAQCTFDVEITNNNAPSILTLYMDNLNINCETNTASVNVYADNFTDIRGAQFNVSWSNTFLQYVDTSNIVFTSGFTTFGTSNISNGQLSFSWGDVNPLTLPNGTILFTLNFTLDAPAGITYPVQFFNNPMIPTEFTVANPPSTIPQPLTPAQYDLINGSIFIFDNEAPTVTCPADVTANSPDGMDVIVNMIPPTAADNCGILDTAYTLTDAATSTNIGSGTGDASGTTFPVGTTIVEYTISDFDGNSTSCDFNVVVTNDAPGILTLYMDNLNLNCEANTASINVYADNFIDMRGVQFNINWSNTFIQYIDTSNIVFTSGVVAFGNSNISNGQLSFSWGDVNPLTLPNGTVLFTINFSLSAPAGITIPIQFFDNPMIPTEFTVANPPSTIPVPLTPAQYELINGSIFIFDSEPPMVTCPADITMTSTNGTDAIVNGIPPTASDNCGILDTTYTLTNVADGSNIISGSGDASGFAFPVGTTNVEYTISDFDGNTTSCDLNVTVLEPGIYTIKIDSVDVDCSSNTASVGFSLDNFINVSGFQFTIEWDETKLQYANLTENITPPGLPGTTMIANGIFTYSWFGPATTFPNGFEFIEIEFDILDNSANDYDIEFVTTGAPTPSGITVQNSGQLPGPPPASQTAFVNGNVEINDNATPTLSCPADVTVSANGMSSVPVSMIDATASDNCGTPTVTYTIATTPPVSGMGNASGNSFPEGTTMVTYTATDAAGNSVSCNFNVTVIQDPLMIACPSNINQIADVDECSAAIGSLPISVLSDSMNVASVTYELIGPNNNFDMGTGDIPAMSYEVGTTTLVYTVTDIFGAIEKCTLTVVISDTQAPIFNNPPQNATVECDNIPPVVNPTATDNCDGNVAVIFNGETTLPGGNTIVRLWSTFDAAGNGSNVSQTLNIVDTTPPSLSCPPDITLNANISLQGTCGTTAPLGATTAIDNCDTDVQTTSTHNSGDFFPLGVTTVTSFAIDDDGNLDSCKFTVTIIDVDAPVIMDCPTDIVISGGIDCATSVTWTPPTATDNCDNNVTLTSMPALGSNFSIGTTPVTYTATDASGNSTTCSFNVTVSDNIAPSIACPADIIVSTNGNSTDPNNFLTSITPVGCDSVALTFGFPLAADNCGVPTIIQNTGLASGSTYGIGNHIIEFIATDGAGNKDTCEMNISVIPFLGFMVTANPDTICLNESTVLSTDVSNTFNHTWTAPDGTAYDTPTVTISNATLADSGTYLVTIIDPNTMCTSNASVELVVQEGPDISIVANSLNCTNGTIDIPLNGINNGAVNIATWTWTDPNNNVFSTDQNTVIAQATESNSGMYCLTATSSNGCATEVCQEITITDNPIGTPTINPNCDAFLCVGESCDLVGFFTEPDIDSVAWTVDNANGGLVANGNQATITPTQDGIYIYTFTIFSDGCSSSTNFPLQVSSPANVSPDDISVEFNGSTTYNVTDNDVINGSLPGTFTINITSDVSNGTLINNGNGTITYTPDESFFGTDQFIYEICLDCNDETICRWAIATINVTTEECLIPTVITPNDDGMNDALEITCVDQNLQNELVVYNRWGDEVYRASPYTNDWKGTYNDQPLPDGTYFYVFLRNPTDSEPEKGSITIMR